MGGGGSGVSSGSHPTLSEPPQLVSSSFLTWVMEGHEGHPLPLERFSLSLDRNPGTQETPLVASVKIDAKPDTLPTECCSTDTTGGKAEKLLSPPLTHMLLWGFFIKKLDGTFPTVHSH